MTKQWEEGFFFKHGREKGKELAQEGPLDDRYKTLCEDDPKGASVDDITNRILDRLTKCFDKCFLKTIQLDGKPYTSYDAELINAMKFYLKGVKEGFKIIYYSKES